MNQTKKITLILNNLGILTINHKPFVANIGRLSQTFSLFFLESNKQPQLYTVHFGPLSYSSFSQLLRQSNWLTFPKSKADRFFCTMWPVFLLPSKLKPFFLQSSSLMSGFLKGIFRCKFTGPAAGLVGCWFSMALSSSPHVTASSLVSPPSS